MSGSSLTKNVKLGLLAVVAAFPLWLPLAAQAGYVTEHVSLGWLFDYSYTHSDEPLPATPASTFTNNFGCGGLNNWLPAVKTVSAVDLGANPNGASGE